MIVRLQHKACHLKSHGTLSSRPGSNSEHGSSIDILNDFDHSVEQSDDCCPANIPREGFLPFLPVALVLQSGRRRGRRFEQKYYHSLESILYVLCFICSTHSDPGKPRRCIEYCENITRWYGRAGERLWEVGAYKAMTVRSKGDFEENILVDIRPDLGQIKPCLKRLRALLNPVEKDTVEAYREMYITNGKNLKDIPFGCTAMEERDPDEFFSNVEKELQDTLVSLENSEGRMFDSDD